MCGRKSKIGFRGIAIGSFLLLLLASPCFAAASWGAFTSGDSAKAEPIATIEEPTLEEPSQNDTSGTVPEPISETPSESSNPPSMNPEEVEKLELQDAAELVKNSGVWLSAGDRTFIIDKLESADGKLAALKEASEAKDKEIADLKDDLSKADSATGTRAYLMLDGIIGFQDRIPEYGVGLTLGTRIGNHAMVELGADYTIGRFSDGMTIKQFSIDNFEFRASVGWMF